MTVWVCDNDITTEEDTEVNDNFRKVAAILFFLRHALRLVPHFTEFISKDL